MFEWYVYIACFLTLYVFMSSTEESITQVWNDIMVSV